MTDLFHSFDGIIADYEAALQTLADVLDHIQRTNPDPRLRVVLLNNTIVALTSTIEEILRALFQEYLTILEANFADYRLLRADLQKANLGCAALELRALKSADDFKTATALISNLSICMNGHLGYRLLKDKLVYNQRNFRSGQVTEISKNLGLSNLWNSVCESSEIEVYTGESNLDSRKNRLITKWNELFDERDW